MSVRSREEGQSQDASLLPHTGVDDSPDSFERLERNVEVKERVDEWRDEGSSWKIGWKTPALMGVCYIIATIVATGHLLLLLYLDHKTPTETLPQTYVTTISTTLSNMFSVSIGVSLALAFVQYLWHTLRRSSMTISTIEALFVLRSNPFLVVESHALWVAPMLVCMALLIWCMPFLMSFPPGALTVITKRGMEGVKGIDVWGFDPSFISNGSRADAAAAANSLDTFFRLGSQEGSPDLVLSHSMANNVYPSSLKKLATRVMINGQPIAIPSPCGANCTYTLQFEGPYVQCLQTTRDNITMSIGSSKVFDVYDATFNTTATTPTNRAVSDGQFESLSSYYINITILQNPTNYIPKTFSKNGTFITTIDNTICIPYRAIYSFSNTYSNHIQTFNISASPQESLLGLRKFMEIPDFSTLEDGSVGLAGSNPRGLLEYGNIPATWSHEAKSWHRDVNILTIIGSVWSPLIGSFKASPYSYEWMPESVKGEAGPKDAYWSYQQNMNRINGLLLGPQNVTVAGYTPLNTAYYQTYKSAEDELRASDTISFKATRDLLNSLLINVTLSVMTKYALWNTTVNTTTYNTVIVYSFSRPLNLYVPYGIALFLSFIFIATGGMALHWNGVAASDVGFVQLLCTTTASPRLNDVAKGNCLGGSENAKKELLGLRVRFGEVVDSGSGERKAGFGFEDEVVCLDRGVSYGIRRRHENVATC